MNPPSSTHAAHPRETDAAPGTGAHAPRAIKDDDSLRLLIRVLLVGTLLLLGSITAFCLLFD